MSGYLGWLRPAAVVVGGLVVAPVVLPTAVSAQACAAGVISEIRITRLNIFDVDPASETSADASAEPTFAEKLAGSVHIPTSESFVRNELLFAEGDCLDPFLLSESERNLRAFLFIAEAQVTREELPDGSHRVDVMTRDDWSLGLSFGVSFDGGLSVEGVALTESNFLGRGMTLSGFGRESRESRELGGLFRSTKLLGSRFDAVATGGQTRVGNFYEASLFRPFVSEIGRLAVRAAVDYREDYFAYSAPGSATFTQAVLPLQSGRYEATVASRFGELGALTLVGMGLSVETIDYPTSLGELGLVLDDDFVNPVGSGPAELTEVAPQTLGHGATRLNFMIGRREVAFVQRTGLDGLRAVQDVFTGWDVVVTAGASLPLFEDRFHNPADDWFGRVELAAGTALDNWVLGSRLRVEGRDVQDGRGGPEGWRDVLGEGEVNIYFQSEALPRHTLYGRFWAGGGWNTGRPFQLTVGGREGVRGYSRDSFPAGRKVVATLEDRIQLDWPGSDVFSLGLALFADVGQGWAGDAPFGVDSGLRSSIGAGVRVGAPGESTRVIRVEFTLPVTGDRSTEGASFRFYGEVLGLLDRRDRPDQMERSRWLGIDPDLATRPRVR